MEILASTSLDSLGDQLIKAASTVVIVPLVALLPMFGILAWLFWERRKCRSTLIDPFTELPLRPPGESLRLKIDELMEKFDGSLIGLTLVGMSSIAGFLVSRGQPAPILGAAAVVLAGYIYFGRRLVATAKKLWRYRLAYTGERVVGEELNQLLTAGFRVFHDVPFENFNIDHVLVGPPGVYVIETKTRSKRADIKGVERATVVFDGSALHFPNGTDVAAIEQARRNAETLAQWLTKATGERVTASGIVTLPGWWVERKAVSDVNVLNPAEIKHSFRPSQRPLLPEQIQRIGHQLTERCRLPKTPAK